MIRKQDILDRAGEWNLRADVVEKDYVLGWLLAAFGAHPTSSSTWVFKGGTCLKKCFFETYRFSEDLDFSLLPDAPYSQESIQSVIVEAVTVAAEQSGIEFPADRVAVDIRKDKLDRPTFRGRVSYRGPLAMPNWPRVLLDITQNEPVVAPVDRRAIFHPYPDALPSGATVACYSLAELYAEKTRALLERTRPRDLYDVAHLGERHDEVRLEDVRAVFRKKCESKGFAAPSASTLMTVVDASDELRSEWANMLGHQLPALPSVDHMLERVRNLVAWIDEPTAPAVPVAPRPSVPLRRLETTFAPRGGHYWGGGASLEIVRFAGANQLMVEFTYHGKRRLAEPYSLRRPATGNLLLYAWEQGATTIKAFNTPEMHDVAATNVPFDPRYRVEFTGV
jgi:predicted nucleotidyltransferase component of viral defense system